ncbi:MAG: 30S ribosomal protein S5 [Patescibacteria group bacterium]
MVEEKAQTNKDPNMPGEKRAGKTPFRKGGSRSGGGGGGGKQRRGPRPERAKPEFDQKIIDIRRVARVVTGGRRFSFSVAVVAGDRKGRVGIGTGKAGDTSLAIEKAFKNAKKNMVKVKLTKNMSIPHEVEIKLNSARLMLLPAPGRGIVAGSSVRTVLDLLGAKDVGAKIFSRSKNKLNNARAALQALQVFKV